MLSKDEADRIEAAIRSAEAATSAEIVICIRRSSGEDRGVAAMAGALALLLALGLVEAVRPDLHVLVSLVIALATAIAAFLLCDRLDLGLKLLPAELVAKGARRTARATFLDRALDATPERNAVLLFISRAERYVEILPDRGLAAQVVPQRWENIVASFRDMARKRGMVEAAADAIGRIGAVCAGPFPASTENADLIGNAPVAD